jgi:dTDP-glucose pyrophosphorylase
MKPTLFVLAAGMGSRYGGLKQMDGIGPNGETIMEYSIYDAIRSGFGKVVFVIRHSFEKEFNEFVNKRFASAIPVEIVFQELDSLPEGYHLNKEREKPWGTNHAVLMGKGAIREPFCVINADDFYGKESFETISRFLQSVDGKTGQYAMVGYRVCNTLSESGSVARGVCGTNADNYLTTVVERTQIERVDGKIQYNEQGEWYGLAENTPVSMNMWALTPDYFDYSEEAFKLFLDERGNELKSEFFIPLVVNNLVKSSTATVKVLDTTSQWFGVTYKEDKPAVIEQINKLIEQKIYPSVLW